MVALAARIVSRSSAGRPHAAPSRQTPSRRRGALSEDETGCSPFVAGSAGAAEREAAAGWVEVAAGAAGVLGVGGVPGGVGGVAGAAGAARAAGVAGPAPSSCGAARSASRSASSAASWKA